MTANLRISEQLETFHLPPSAQCYIRHGRGPYAARAEAVDLKPVLRQIKVVVEDKDGSGSWSLDQAPEIREKTGIAVGRVFTDDDLKKVPDGSIRYSVKNPAIQISNGDVFTQIPVTRGVLSEVTTPDGKTTVRAGIGETFDPDRVRYYRPDVWRSVPKLRPVPPPQLAKILPFPEKRDLH